MSKQAIMCVDDEAIILIAMKQELKRHFGNRFMLETALNAEDALEMIDDLKAEEVDVIIVISDWLMPGMKGDEFLVRVHERFPRVAAIMVTGQADESAIERALTIAKARACLRKPWRSRDLISTIETILAERATA